MNTRSYSVHDQNMTTSGAEMRSFNLFTARPMIENTAIHDEKLQPPFMHTALCNDNL